MSLLFRLPCVIAAAALLGLAGCGNGDCTTESCPGSTTQYQSCLQGTDFVVRDVNGEEYSRCATDYESVGGVTGGDRNGCADKHARSKLDFCSAHPGSGSTRDGGASVASTRDGGGVTSAPASCYIKDNGAHCFCQGTAIAAPSGFHPVTSCTAEGGVPNPVCCAPQDGDGLVSQCNCSSSPRACRDNGTSCECPQTTGDYDPAEVRASCTPTGGRICCISPSYCQCKPEQYAGAGCIGFGGVNEGATRVAGCAASPTKPAIICASGERTSCDGLRYRP